MTSDLAPWACHWGSCWVAEGSSCWDSLLKGASWSDGEGAAVVPPYPCYPQVGRWGGGPDFVLLLNAGSLAEYSGWSPPLAALILCPSQVWGDPSWGTTHIHTEDSQINIAIQSHDHIHTDWSQEL